VRLTDEMPSFEPGMIYEDCAFHPVLCTNVHSDNSVSGISLIDGSAPRTCDLDSCGVIPLTVSEVLAIRKDFDGYVQRRRKGLGISSG